MFDGLKQALKIKQFWYWLLITFIGLGLFNGISTWIEGIVRPRGFTPTDAGTLGAVLLLGGVLGAVALPALSDKTGKRQLFLTLASDWLFQAWWASLLPIRFLSCWFQVSSWGSFWSAPIPLACSTQPRSPFQHLRVHSMV